MPSGWLRPWGLTLLPEPFVPEPDVRTMVLDTRGERWVVTFADRRLIQLHPTVDNPEPFPKWLTRRTWRQHFYRKEWLTV